MKIVSLKGTRDIVGGESHFDMAIDALGETYNIPISEDTYLLLNELAILVRDQLATNDNAPVELPRTVEAPPGQAGDKEPVLEWGGDIRVQPGSIPSDHQDALEQFAKIGLFEPGSVLDSVLDIHKQEATEGELMGTINDEEEDPGELSDGVDQYAGD